MNKNTFNVEDFINQKKAVEATDGNVAYKNARIILELAKKSLASALMEALPTMAMYDSRMLDFCSHSNALASVLSMCGNSDENIEEDKVIQSAVNLFLDQVEAGKYRYSFVDTLDAKQLDDKKVYPIVRDGDIELVKVMLVFYPKMLAKQDHRIEKLAKRDPEVKEMFDNALADMEQ